MQGLGENAWVCQQQIPAAEDFVKILVAEDSEANLEQPGAELQVQAERVLI